MPKTFKDTHDKYQWVIKNWDKLSNNQMARELGVSPSSIAQMGALARKKGIKLPRKNSNESVLRGVSWKKLITKE